MSCKDFVVFGGSGGQNEACVGAAIQNADRTPLILHTSEPYSSSKLNIEHP
jgi:hypothetical protein